MPKKPFVLPPSDIEKEKYSDFTLPEITNEKSRRLKLFWDYINEKRNNPNKIEDGTIITISPKIGANEFSLKFFNFFMLGDKKGFWTKNITFLDKKEDMIFFLRINRSQTETTKQYPTANGFLDWLTENITIEKIKPKTREEAMKLHMSFAKPIGLNFGNPQPYCNLLAFLVERGNIIIGEEDFDFLFPMTGSSNVMVPSENCKELFRKYLETISKPNTTSIKLDIATTDDFPNLVNPNEDLMVEPTFLFESNFADFINREDEYVLKFDERVFQLEYISLQKDPIPNSSVPQHGILIRGNGFSLTKKKKQQEHLEPIAKPSLEDDDLINKFRVLGIIDKWKTSIQKPNVVFDFKISEKNFSFTNVDFFINHDKELVVFRLDKILTPTITSNYLGNDLIEYVWCFFEKDTDTIELITDSPLLIFDAEFTKGIIPKMKSKYLKEKYFNKTTFTLEFIANPRFLVLDLDGDNSVFLQLENDDLDMPKKGIYFTEDKFTLKIKQ